MNDESFLKLFVADSSPFNSAEYNASSTSESSCSESAKVEVSKPLHIYRSIPPVSLNESQYVIEDEKEYSQKGEPGRVIIFNQKTFDNEQAEERAGTIPDINELILTFDRFGYKITKNDIQLDYTKKQIFDKLDEVSREDHSNRTCLIIIILTHGNQNNTLEAKDASFNAKEVWDHFTAKKCETLVNKPKFFIFQACKGNSTSEPLTDTAVTSYDSAYPLLPSRHFTEPLERDMLIAFASVEGKKSFRHIYEGSWFIQELCRNFSIYGHMDDVVSLLLRTTKCVAYNYYHEEKEIKKRSVSEELDSHYDEKNKIEFSEKPESSTIIKQMPIFISTLTKRFYLSRSRERQRHLHMMEQAQRIHNCATEIITKFESISAAGSQTQGAVAAAKSK